MTPQTASSINRRHRAALAAAAALALAAVAPAAADASTVSTNLTYDHFGPDATELYYDDSGDKNELEVDYEIKSGAQVVTFRENKLNVDYLKGYDAGSQAFQQCPSAWKTAHSVSCRIKDVDLIRIYLGGGNDYVLYRAPIRSEIYGAEGKDALWGGPGPDTLVGGDKNDFLSGGDDVDTLQGEAGDDSLYGGAGGDTLQGGDNNDRMKGDGGADVFAGGGGTDTADYSAYTVPLKIDIDNKWDDGADGENDNVKTDVENVTGGWKDDELTGSGLANVLDGRKGNDRIRGGAGADTLKGKEGADQLIAFDWQTDTLVDCGLNADIAWVDLADPVVGCETTYNAPVPN